MTGPILASLPAPRLAEPVTVAVVADPHLAVDATGTWKRFGRTETLLRTAVGVAADADYCLFLGDLTRDGHPDEFDRFDAVVGELSVPWSAVPGNHDVPKAFDDHDTPSVDAVASRYAPDGRFPFAVTVGGLTLVCLDSATAGGDLTHTWGGRVGGESRRWLDRTLAGAETAVVALHHNVGGLPEHGDGYPWDRFTVEDADAVADVLAAHDVPLVLSGHQHVPAVTALDAAVEVVAPAACSFPQAMLELAVGPNGTTVRHVPLADRAGVADAYLAAGRGKSLGVALRSLATDRLGRYPLVDGGDASGTDQESVQHCDDE